MTHSLFFYRLVPDVNNLFQFSFGILENPVMFLQLAERRRTQDFKQRSHFAAKHNLPLSRREG